MAKRAPKKDLLDLLSDFIASHKGVPVLIGVGLVIVGLVLTLIPPLWQHEGFWGWLTHSHLLLYVGSIVGFVGLLIGDAL
jgi:hypothetical protein